MSLNFSVAGETYRLRFMYPTPVPVAELVEAEISGAPEISAEKVPSFLNGRLILRVAGGDPEEWTRVPPEDRHYTSRDTICYIEKCMGKGQPWKIIGEGSAACAAEDRFEKEIGRRIALSRAISPLPKPIRKGALYAYWSR